MVPPRRLLWPILAAAGIVAEAIGFGFGEAGKSIPDLLTGWMVGACGLIAWSARAGSLVGPLLFATSLLWFAGDVSTALVFAYRAPLVQLTLTYPHGRPRGRAQSLGVVGGYVAAAIEPIWRSEVATILLSGALVALAAGAHSGARGRERRERAYALGATVALAAGFAATALVRWAAPTPTANHVSLIAFEAGLAALAVALVVGLLREPWSRVRASDLVVELAETRSGELRDQLARALGDPTLEIAFGIGAQNGYVDAAGRPIALPEPGSPRQTTELARNGDAVAVLIHDPALVGDPNLADALSRAAQLGATNARLQAEVRAQIAELQASRRRLLAAADDERRRLEERLERTAERRLAQLLPDLDAARRAAGPEAERARRLERAHRELEQSLRDLRRLAVGLHPRELASGGLTEALRAVAARSPLAVELDLALPEQLGAEAERTAYFVCSEGLANVVKYSGASRARVNVETAGGQLHVEVDDDGPGGADPARGTGLRGLADRVEALGGQFEVDSPPGGGTRLVARIPLT
jgi:signal transduction histidine kinase